MTKKLNSKYILALLLAISFTFKTQLFVSQSQLNIEMPKGERFRSFISAMIWQRADQLMHRGAIDEKNQKFKAGSYVGNTDIIPMLRLVTKISPQELAPYQILARSLSYAWGDIDEGVKLLQQCIIQNQGQSGLHEIYASIAFLKLFMNNKDEEIDLTSPLKYLQKAANLLVANKEQVSSDPAYTLENYKILMARLYVDLEKPDEALKILSKAGIALEGSKDLIFSYLSQYKNTGMDAQTFLNMQETTEENFKAYVAEPLTGKTACQQYSTPVYEDVPLHNSQKKGKATNPTLKYYFSILRSGLLFMLVLVFGFLSQKTKT